ncbi:MAG: phosphatase PAP2 family protein [Epulopiscium sp.]|nr:phosphatase PAP2 family protein [Candidatus Epulonipiscium sp.]
MDGLQAWDESVVLWVRNHMSSPFLDVMAKGVSTLGNHGLIWILLGIAFMIWGTIKRNELWKWGVLFLFCLGTNSLLVNAFIKPWAERIRPYDQLGLDILISPLRDFSFPSGHTAAAFVAVRIGYGINKSFGRCMLIFAVCMAFSRLYLAVHYPSDIIAGAFLGWGWTYLILFLIKAMKKTSFGNNKKIAQSKKKC